MEVTRNGKTKSCVSGLCRFIFAVAITILLMSGMNVAGAATITVDDSGGADYSVIQYAIDNASAGDTILVNSGTYYENVLVNKSLVLQGNDTGGVIRL